MNLDNQFITAMEVHKDYSNKGEPLLMLVGIDICPCSKCYQKSPNISDDSNRWARNNDNVIIFLAAFVVIISVVALAYKAYRYSRTIRCFNIVDSFF